MSIVIRRDSILDTAYWNGVNRKPIIEWYQRNMDFINNVLFQPLSTTPRPFIVIRYRENLVSGCPKNSSINLKDIEIEADTYVGVSMTGHLKLISKAAFEKEFEPLQEINNHLQGIRTKVGFI